MRDFNQNGAVFLEGDVLRIGIKPQLGGTIVSICNHKLDADILGSTPWSPISLPIASHAADEMTWLTRYEGGWPLLFPNGGDACEFGGVFHGFHGEASMSPWEFDVEKESVQLRRKFFTVPVEMHREISLLGDVLRINEKIVVTGEQPIEVLWAHHPTFGADLLDGDFVIETGARTIAVDDSYDSLSNPFKLGATGRWPIISGKNGQYDVSRPKEPLAALTYLYDFDQPWVSVRRLDDSVAAMLSWDADLFKCVWLWYELGGTLDAPWFGNARLLGVEPSTSWPATGLADIKRRGGHLLRLSPGQSVRTTLCLNVFKPDGAIQGVDGNGRAIIK